MHSINLVKSKPHPPDVPLPPAPVGGSGGQQQMTPSVAAKLTEGQGMCAAFSQPIR